ncbi:hypothetical protein FUA26_13935 [Seonamhaeicola algicola]|uniref:Uncharacterized protein n=2 Tax=Seonamhaeicola TaxID=1649495 RepID=A0A5C7ACX6_9FLAO|nr:hypothetical protein [Seonamhaeicola algicola]TXE06077.1 hypothetical protein FUA26_13935 [Seonamhaeicola algicola]
MCFNIIFEVIIGLLLLVLSIAIIITIKRIFVFNENAKKRNQVLAFKVSLAKKENAQLQQKTVLVNAINTTLYPRFFSIIEQILSLQKNIFDESL